MAIVVSLFGVLMCLICLLGVAMPRRLIDVVSVWHGPSRFRVAVVVRLVMGIFLLVAAPSCRLPTFVFVLGAVALVAAVTLLIVGPRRLDLLIKWWLWRRVGVVRISCLVAFAFGALLVYAGG